MLLGDWSQDSPLKGLSPSPYLFQPSHQTLKTFQTSKFCLFCCPLVETAD